MSRSCSVEGQYYSILQVVRRVTDILRVAGSCA